MKGLSPVVAMIILVLITVVVAGTMAMWARQYIEERSQNATMEEARMTECLKTSLSLVSSSYDNATDILSIILENDGMIKIDYINMTLISPTGIYEIRNSHLVEGNLETDIPPAGITLLKIDANAAAIPSGDYTLRVSPNGCPNALRANVKVG